MRVCIVFCFILLNSSCIFGGSRYPGKVRTLNHQVVSNGAGGYQVGPLDKKQWKLKDYTSHALSYQHVTLIASISTQSICNEEPYDLDLKYRLKDFLYAVQDEKIMSQNRFSLDNSEAQRLVATAVLDKESIIMDVINIKSGNCLIEFYLISRPNAYLEVKEDFENFYQAFHRLEKRKRAK